MQEPVENLKSGWLGALHWLVSFGGLYCSTISEIVGKLVVAKIETTTKTN
jgi:hypothetical protein